MICAKRIILFLLGVGGCLGPEPMDMPTSSPPPVRGVRSSDVLTLQVHTAEVWASSSWL